jgi:hypothetical protein
MFPLTERVPDRFSIGAKLGIDGHQLRAAVNDLHALYLRLEPEHPRAPHSRRIAP